MKNKSTLSKLKILEHLRKNSISLSNIDNILEILFFEPEVKLGSFFKQFF